MIGGGGGLGGGGLHSLLEKEALFHNMYICMCLFMHYVVIMHAVKKLISMLLIGNKDYMF